MRHFRACHGGPLQSRRIVTLNDVNRKVSEMKRQAGMRLGIAAWIGFAFLAAPAFPQNPPVVMNVKVTSEVFDNPAVRFTFTVESPGTPGAQWACKAGPPAFMKKGWGWTEDSLQSGEVVTIRGRLTSNQSHLVVQSVEKEARHLKLQKKADGDPAVECDRQSGPAR